MYTNEHIKGNTSLIDKMTAGKSDIRISKSNKVRLYSIPMRMFLSSIETLNN
jgi:hypothetical protein